MGNHSLLLGVFPIQGPNLGLLHCRWILYLLNHQESNAAYPVTSTAKTWVWQMVDILLSLFVLWLRKPHRYPLTYLTCCYNPTDWHGTQSWVRCISDLLVASDRNVTHTDTNIKQTSLAPIIKPPVVSCRPQMGLDTGGWMMSLRRLFFPSYRCASLCAGFIPRQAVSMGRQLEQPAALDNRAQK